jgi:hypothetical protein
VRAASLTASLLVAKGAATPTRTRRPLDIGGTIERLDRPRREHGEGGDGTIRVTLRMNRARHLRLRLAAAHLGRSNQALMLAAVDYYIDNLLPLLMAGHCACLEQGHMPAGGCAALGFGRAHPNHPDHPT